MPSLRALLSLTKQQLAPYGDHYLCYAGDGTVLTFDAAFGSDRLSNVAMESGIIQRLALAGVQGVTYFLAHIDDRGETAVEASDGDTMVDDYYDLSIPDRRFFAHGSYDVSSIPVHHHLTVGDLCYFFLGQIVNRGFDPLLTVGQDRFARFNGPSMTPNLAVEARREWGGITDERLRQSLIRDAIHPLVLWRDVGAIRRLAKCYPGKYIPDLIIQRLKTPLKEIWSIDESVAPFGSGTRSHEVLRFPTFITPPQMSMFLLSIADIKTAKVDTFLARFLNKMSRWTKFSFGDDQIALSIVHRLERSHVRANLAACIKVCLVRAKDSLRKDLFIETVRKLKGKSPGHAKETAPINLFYSQGTVGFNMSRCLCDIGRGMSGR